MVYSGNEVEKPRRKRKQYTAPALEKGLDVLELLSSDATGLNLSSIASQLNRSVGEIFRVVVVLEQRGYVAPVPDSDRYALTGKMYSVSHGYAPIQQVTIVAGPIMRRLAQATSQSCHLVIYHNGRGIIVAQQDSPNERCLNVRLGAEAPLTDTCSGHVLLAFADAEKRKSMLAERPERSRKRIKKAKLDDMLEAVLSRGYELVDSGQVQGVKDIGFPVFDLTGDIRAALVVPFLTHIDGSNHVTIDTATQYLSNAAGEISDLLGFRPERAAQTD